MAVAFREQTSTETEPCPACAAADARQAGTYNGFNVFDCAGCGLLFVGRHQLASVDYDKVYAELPIYRQMTAEAERAAAGQLPESSLWWSKRTALRWLPKHAPGRSLVDVGSGPGTFLMFAKRHGWDVRGIELSETTAKLANSLGVQTLAMPLDRAVGAINGSRADAVSCFEVLEHVVDPRAFAQHLRSLLKDGGVLFLSVPNRDDPYLLRLQIPEAVPPVHINFFNRKSLRQLFTAAGFRHVGFRTLPIPTASVRILYGRRGLFLRLPWLMLKAVLRRGRGTTLLVMAKA